MVRGDEIDSPLDAPGAAELARASLTLARSLAAGATMWCIAPDLPAHARHIAVEFVHPVVVGTKALPAVAMTGADVVASLRAAGRPGDVAVVVGPAADGRLVELLRRMPAWGITSIWLALDRDEPEGGARPVADHVLRVADGDHRAATDGRLVMLYHLLWELTHVCFEHPGLLSRPAGAERCTTCADDADLAEVVGAAGRDVTVRTRRGLEVVDGTMVPGVGAGDLLLVHAGTAISVVDGAP